MTESAEYHGGLVAFEGPVDLVSTQLRLLPTSSQIAILPSVKEFLDPEDPDQPFEARKFVKRVHNAVAKRREMALSFLKESTPKRKRLVFMNGGTPSAQTVCIRAISRNETGGDITKAEAIFNEIVRGGVAALDEHPTSRGSFLDTTETEDVVEDPITRAMRAADALDRETESLQPSSDIDLTLSSGRPRSMSLPLYSFADKFGDAAPFYVFGEQPSDDITGSGEAPAAIEVPKLSSTTPRLAITNFDELEKFAALDFNFENKSAVAFPPRSPSCAGEVYAPETGASPSPNPPALLDVASPRSEVFSIRSTEPIVIEQASIVRMKSSASAKSLSRSQSVGRLHRSNSRYRDTLVRLKTKEKAEEKRAGDRRRSSVVELIEDAERRDNKAKLTGAAKTVYVKPARLNKSLPPPPLSPITAEEPEQVKSNYVDRGTDAEEVMVKSSAFQPVLPFSEDLVIHFKDDSPDPILEYMIRAFKEGVYPVALPSSSTSVADGDASAPQTPTWQPEDSQVSHFTPAKTVHTDEYDPFSYQGPAYSSKQLHPVSQTVTASTLPTPANTPPPTLLEPEDKFHDFNTVHCQTAVAMQNSLRSVLNIYFPPKARGFCQFNFPLLPEMDGLWKPIFRDMEPGGSPRKENRRIDQILAIGSQKGVKKTFLSSIACQLEKLGTKSTGVSRTGKLDFRYLIANAMQSFTAQPLANQTHDNPFTNSYLLATLIIPHLETYFAAHSEVRFLLLDYPPDHLATILALQKLVGVDLMKVAQVIDADTREPLPFTHIRGGSVGRISNRSDLASSSGSLQSKQSTAVTSSSSPDGVAVSKANFLLTSKATDAEISTFVSTIWKILTNISRFYLPEDSLVSGDKRRSGNFSQFSAHPPVSPPMSPPSSSSRRVGKRSVSIKTSGRPSSIAETIKSRRAKSRRGEKNVLGDGASVLTVDLDYESDLDLEERRLMPMFLKKTQARKGNSRKALKFLGLA
ncbi:gastric mucin-like protein [Colletotrichum plurivorum]|uniref:Gastric mucin-like protein n=1 Tax=Colletotrichum plurivorum TaxID=2175906 RepID=A0A8H6NQ23_9PEZI|nr:gastric mucin-like protein [Colletotrichum plurivorum]